MKQQIFKCLIPLFLIALCLTGCVDEIVDADANDSINVSSDSTYNASLNEDTLSEVSSTEAVTDNSSSAGESSTPPTSKPSSSSNIVSSEPVHTHSFSPATCTAPRTCSCGATEGTAKGHNWKDATYTAAKTCTTCGATEGDPIDPPGKENYHGHVYTGGSSSKKYHYEANCAGKNSHEITWDEVSRRGLGPCGTCVLK